MESTQRMALWTSKGFREEGIRCGQFEKGYIERSVYRYLGVRGSMLGMVEAMATRADLQTLARSCECF